MRMRGIAFLALGLITLTLPAQAGEMCVTIGEVSSQVAGKGASYEPMLRAASEDELRLLNLKQVPASKRVVVSVALVRLDTLAQQHSVDATCKVTATLRDARAGTLFAVLEGQAQASSSEPPGAVESSAVRGAIHGALAHIPEALRR